MYMYVACHIYIGYNYVLFVFFYTCIIYFVYAHVLTRGCAPKWCLGKYFIVSKPYCNSDLNSYKFDYCHAYGDQSVHVIIKCTSY